MHAPAGTPGTPISRSFPGELLELRERRVPELVEEVAYGRETLDTHGIDAARALCPVLHETGFLEHAQVARDGRSADREPCRQLSHCEGGGSQRGQDRPADRISESIESMHTGSSHVTIRTPWHSRAGEEAPDGEGRCPLQGASPSRSRRTNA